MNHGFAVYFLQSQNGIEIEVFSGDFFAEMSSALGAALMYNSRASNFNAFVREMWIPILPI